MRRKSVTPVPYKIFEKTHKEKSPVSQIKSVLAMNATPVNISTFSLNLKNGLDFFMYLHNNIMRWLHDKTPLPPNGGSGVCRVNKNDL